jgi:NADH:ubiquinone oxidoreductase subunit E
MNRAGTEVSDPVDTVLLRHSHAGRDHLIPILQEVQELSGYLSRDAVLRISSHLGLPTSKVYGVATFYNQFRFQAPGRHHIQVCRGTACHVKNSLSVLDAVRRLLKIEPGQTTRDGLFSLEVVACIGACGLAPVAAIDGEFHGGLTAESIQTILQSYRERAVEHA